MSRSLQPYPNTVWEKDTSGELSPLSKAVRGFLDAAAYLIHTRDQFAAHVDAGHFEDPEYTPVECGTLDNAIRDIDGIDLAEIMAMLDSYRNSRDLPLPPIAQPAEFVEQRDKMIAAGLSTKEILKALRKRGWNPSWSPK